MLEDKTSRILIYNTHSKPKPHTTGCNKVSVATHPPAQDLGFVTGDCAPFLSDGVTDCASLANRPVAALNVAKIRAKNCKIQDKFHPSEKNCDV